MNFTRGDVYFGTIELPNSKTPGLDEHRNKLVILLRDSLNEPGAPFLIASTHRSTNVRSFEVLVKKSEADFISDTVIDCRWPYTISIERLQQCKFMFELSEKIMADINVGLVVGLQM